MPKKRERTDLSDLFWIAMLILVMIASPSLRELVEGSGESDIEIEEEPGEEEDLQVEIYSDMEKNPLSSIQWGTISVYPGGGASVPQAFYLENTGNIDTRLSISVRDPYPEDLMAFMDLTWDQENRTVNIGEFIRCELTLTVFPNITGITAFSFDIVINLSS